MKKKLLYIIPAVTLTVTAFLIGRNTTEQNVKAESNIDYESACDFAESIVDFNTDGENLAMILSDGTEIYAYREPHTDEYKGNRIISVLETEQGKIAIKKNGKSYLVNE